MWPLITSDPLYANWQKRSFFHEGEFLGIAQAVQALEQCQESEKPDMLQKYTDGRMYYENMLLLYKSLPVKRFPVVWLRHVTVAEYFFRIVQDGKIDGSYRTFRLNGVERSLRVSCWGVHIPPAELENYRIFRFAQFMQLIVQCRIACNLYPEEAAEVKDMLANSPAMREDSRYGNFQFSFSTKDLLAIYQNQHCGGKKPVLRVLGTEAYKQELVHWILIHSPDQRDFDHLPIIDPQDPFSWDVNLAWAPESMTNQFTFQISSNTLTKKPFAYSNNSLIQTYDSWIWSNIVFAFYLPGNGALQIHRRNLLQNVQACEAAQSQAEASTSNILRHPPQYYTSKAQAQILIEDLKRRGVM